MKRNASWKRLALAGKVRRYCDCCTRRINISARFIYSWKRCKCGNRNTMQLVFAMKPMVPVIPNEHQKFLKRSFHTPKKVWLRFTGLKGATK